MAQRSRAFLGIGVAALLATAGSCSFIRLTSEGTHDPRAEPRGDNGTEVLDLELAHRLTHFDDVQVFRVEETPSERCDPGPTVVVDDRVCHRILESVAAPTVGWARSMTSLVVWDSEFRDADPREVREPTHAVRYVSSFGQADVLFSLRRKRLVVLSADLPPAVGSFAKSYERILLLLAAAMPRDPEVRDLIALEDSVRIDAIEADLPRQPVALWADCPPPPEGTEGYDEAPVPVTAPTPGYPAEAKAMRIQGKVVLHVFVESDGVPCWVKVVAGDPTLADAAVESMVSWRFRPAMRDGDPVGAWMEVPVEFRIQEREFKLPK